MREASLHIKLDALILIWGYEVGVLGVLEIIMDSYIIL